MKTFHIHIEGIVQGVGFRPFIYQLARAHRLNGWVKNSTDGVHIEITTSTEAANRFVEEILDNSPKLSHILSHSYYEIKRKEFDGFDIVESTDTLGLNLPLTPDFALCQDCRNDLRETGNRRHNYAFTTCINCGPRFSIIKKMPYDRRFTTMEEFSQCPECTNEYTNPLNRRHFSQTNSCPTCGIELFSKEGPIAIENIIEQLEQGEILAVKGIGGFLLIGDAANPETIKTLRKRKHRPTKPFAVMYPDLDSIKLEYFVSDKMQDLFVSEISPIVLLQPKTTNLSIHLEGIAPRLNKVGCMIPYAPLFQLILDQFKRPIIATSGNISGSPIIYENKAAENELKEIADLIVMNNRDIVIPQDDSVFSFTSSGDQPIVLRRSRGLAPTLLDHTLELPKKSVLAMGADMKAAFGFTHGNYLYISQYLGDMVSYLTQSYFEKTLDHLSAVLDHQPEVVIVDKHPGYFSNALGNTIATREQLPIYEIQHHKAHFYAVLAENNLLESAEPVLGVIWDGTGYGDDGMIWGGEFFTYQSGHIIRTSHLPYFPFILGDKMPREPRIAALAGGSLMNEEALSIKAKFTDLELQLYQPMLVEPTLQTSSIGRLFDAVASLVLGIDKTSYEGEAAMMLEAAASAAITTKLPIPAYDTSIPNLPQHLFEAILSDQKNGISSSEIALKFHHFLVNLIRQEAVKSGINKLAFSGGVFQNSLLVDLILKELSSNFDLYFHKQLSPNDENISFGQIAWYSMHEKQLSQ